jgi:hypothetical protein
VPMAVTVALLAVQLAAIRPLLSRRTSRVLEGAVLPRSRAHLCYIAAEAAKVVALVALGVGVVAR